MCIYNRMYCTGRQDSIKDPSSVHDVDDDMDDDVDDDKVTVATIGKSVVVTLVDQ